MVMGWLARTHRVLRALNRNIERTLTDRKEMNWGSRKLKRDQQ
jgi:hypothetical protein